ncbi:MAG: leucyl/phenylalanyl-tRNA--protein transferase [Planctomycetales bacterium]|nr:leucyl/phenylalanyl-tRNA--protein transferase [Planctomycetales bacterium]NIM09280.1 leucyl/phenylalanyl-tRNA--protein transferase [Planctomycetales bacterium]NIN08748.1 leucyl/phenylalanyl-tRNA--protein transferase [Planctomycetales bacterium]NIN77867.1 leucyl/phenylalanyl-tRNA--protein transferase [Planctomycetales bacterium]NIO35050.1 leucyl/phenylalanyl-tRNA--protein transferase [Planctomycetales bacterium]
MTEKMNRSRFFPPVETADAEGLVLLGGKLTTHWLLDAYSHGIFPWPIFDDENLLAWWSPDPRAILELDGLVVSRRLRRTWRSGRFRVTRDHDFAAVLHGCATAGDRQGNTWLIPPMIRAYQDLHAAGCAHSVEVWQADQLVGGTYGVSLGGYFSAESKFHRVSNASKIALVALVSHLKARGFQLLDIQQLSDHARRLGGTEIPRCDFIQRLTIAQKLPVTFGTEQNAP